MAMRYSNENCQSVGGAVIRNDLSADSLSFARRFYYIVGHP